MCQHPTDPCNNQPTGFGGENPAPESGGATGSYVSTSFVYAGVQWTGITSARENTIVKSTFDHIASSLRSDLKCLDFLASGTYGGGNDASNIEKLLNTIDTFEHHTGIGTPSEAATAQTFRDSSQSGGFSIALSLNGGFFNSVVGVLPSTIKEVTDLKTGTDAFRVFVLLHEFGHYFGAPGFTSGDSGVNGTNNNDLVWKDCSETVLRAN